MKKYIAIVVNGNNVMLNSNGIQTLQKATEWANNHINKNNGWALVCEVTSVVERPAQVVIVSPFTLEAEELSVNHS